MLFRRQACMLGSRKYGKTIVSHYSHTKRSRDMFYNISPPAPAPE